jgi:hypothetical protein
VDQLRGSGVDFVARYYRDPTSSLPALSPSEAQKLSSLGLNIVAVWEQNSPDPENVSYSIRYDDATSAYRQARAIGQPTGSAIYFAVDFNAHDLEPVKEYFHGIAAGLAAASDRTAKYKVGVYGSGAVCEAMKRAGLARYSWLSKATSWDGSLDYNDWNIKQARPYQTSRSTTTRMKPEGITAGSGSTTLISRLVGGGLQGIVDPEGSRAEQRLTSTTTR